MGERGRVVRDAGHGATEDPQLAGSQGGVLMHLPDQAQPTEVFVKTTADGRRVIGPRGAIGLPQDRVVMYFQGGILIMEWVDPSVKERYGTMLFVRCA